MGELFCKLTLIYILLFGFDINKEEIFSSLMAAKQVIQKLKLKPYLILEEEAKEDFKDIESVDNEHQNGIKSLKKV